MKFVPGLLAATMAGLALASVSAQAQQITGAGATFPAPVYAKWGEAAKAATGIELNYQAIGSGGGQNQILNRTVDFGASDAPMAADKLASGNLLQFPSVMGAVVVVVNLPGVKPDEMKLTGDVLADIYLGKVRKWNDPRIAELNHDVTLPSVAIAPIYRADGSGTTYVFTSYLSAVSADWKSKVGAATSVKWAAGNGAKGNDGVAATVRQVRGGIGYVEFAYARQNTMNTTQLRNKAGQFVTPTLDAFKAAASSADWAGAANYAVSLVDLAGPQTWPIVSATFIELPKNPTEPARSLNVMKFFDWAYRNGDATAVQLDYVTLPDTVKAAVRSAWASQVKAPDGTSVMK